MKAYLERFKLVAVVFFALAYIGCEDDDIEQLPEIIARFTQTTNPDTGTVRFLNISENADTYEWDFGDGTTSTEINPIKTYGTGDYTITLTAFNSAGASATFEDQISIVLPEVISLPITFDNDNVDYTPTTFSGASFEVLANPDVSGSNDKESNVGAITNSGAEFEGIFFDLGIPVDLADQQSISMNFWSEAPVDVLMKLEEGSGADVETAVSHGGTGWEEIVFDFTSSESFSRMTLFVDGPGTTAGTFYLDDIAQTGDSGGGGDCTAETEQSLAAADFNLTFQTDPGSAIISDGGAFSYIDNPDTDNDVNPSCKVGQIDRDPGLEFANTQIVFDDKFDFNANAGFKLKVWAPAAGTNVLLKLEDKANSAVFAEVSAATTGANAWEELTFDFPASESGKFDKIVLFFELGTFTGETYYIDDFALYARDGGGGNELEDCGGELVNDFETADDTIFSNFGGGVGTVIDNPDTSVNPSARVGQYVKGAGEVFAGITIEVDPDIDFNAGVFSIDVNSQAVRQLLFKLEGVNIEQVIPTSGTGWETLTYDFSAVAGNAGTVTAITLIMDNGTAGDGSADWTIQFDNIRLCSNETGGGGGGGESPFCRTPIQAFGGDAGSDILLSVFNVDAQTMRIEIESADADPVDLLVLPAGAWNPIPGISVPAAEVSPGVWAGEFFFPDGAPENVEFFIEWSKASFAGNWRSTDPAGPLDSVPFNATCDTSGGGGGGGGSTGGCADTPVAATALPLDFEGCETFLPELNFGAGLTSELAPNPSKSGINTSDFVLRVDKPTGSDFFAGIQNVFPSNFDLTTTETFKLKVYSTKANVVFRFELLANPNDGSIGNPAPVFVTVPVANEWTEVEFTFTGLPAGPTAYSQLVIKPDNDQADSPITNGGTYYLDDLRLE